MAQDFYRLFGQDVFGEIGNDTLVNSIDMMGIAMSGLKGAKEEIDLTNQHIQCLKKEIIQLKSENKGFKRKNKFI